MSNERYDIMIPTKRGEKTYWTKVGVAWPTKSGEGFTLDIVPGVSICSVENGARPVLMRPRERDDGAQSGRDRSLERAKRDAASAIAARAGEQRDLADSMADGGDDIPL